MFVKTYIRGKMIDESRYVPTRIYMQAASLVQVWLYEGPFTFCFFFCTHLLSLHSFFNIVGGYKRARGPLSSPNHRLARTLVCIYLYIQGTCAFLFLNVFRTHLLAKRQSNANTLKYMLLNLVCSPTPLSLSLFLFIQQIYIHIVYAP